MTTTTTLTEEGDFLFITTIVEVFSVWKCVHSAFVRLCVLFYWILLFMRIDIFIVVKPFAADRIATVYGLHRKFCISYLIHTKNEYWKKLRLFFGIWFFPMKKKTRSESVLMKKWLEKNTDTELFECGMLINASVAFEWKIRTKLLLV